MVSSLGLFFPSGSPSFTDQHPTKVMAVSTYELIGKMPSFPDESTLDQTTIPAKCICPITAKVMQDPAMLPCGHSFDYVPLQVHLQRQPSCPNCLTPVENEPVKCHGLRQIIREVVKARCPMDGCGASMPIEKLEVHLNVHCQKVR